jgi:rubrerythrin
MQSENQGILEAIGIAMEAEKKASAFYTGAIEKVISSRGKNLLKQLADFEQNHYNKLNELKISLKNEGSYIQYSGTHFKKYKALSEASGAIESNKDELSEILNLAIDAETKASEHYGQLADGTKDPIGKEMFQKLAEEEILHRRILSDEFYQMHNRGGLWFWGD